MQSFQFDERRWQRTSTARYQIDITAVCARLAFEGMQALCYSHWRVCSGAVCLPISTTKLKMFFPLLKVEIHIWLALALSPLPSCTTSFAICQKGRTSDRSQAVLFTPPPLCGQGSPSTRARLDVVHGEGGASGRMERGHVVLPDP